MCVYGHRVQKEFLDFMKLKLQVTQCGVGTAEPTSESSRHSWELNPFLASEDDVFKHSYEQWSHLLSKHTCLELSSNWI